MTLLQTFLRATAFRSPLLRTLLPAVGLAYGIQSLVAMPSIAVQSERFYDLSGSLTYLSCTALSLYLPVLRARAASSTGKLIEPLIGKITGESLLNWRQVAMSAAIGLWATRLGSYLFQRIMADGEDSRFEKIRGQPPKFFGAFMAQATWVSLCALPVIALNALPRTAFAAMPHVLLTDVIGVSLFLFGFLFEIAADRQKNAWVQEKKQKKHSEEFLTRGLWSKSRHPNYFGEICLWTGIATVAGGTLVRDAAQRGLGFAGGPAGRIGVLAMAAVSPAFVTFLLTKVSGIPLSENKYDKRYGDRKDYQEWKKNTPMLIPKF
ncbi:DUF1295-domain-containing protein [Pseudovirgaria hyperparasitica]|uniref:DUF1295-domain-containing protein n=1 Tax=Pseudovirgaria hyperparasitica TaxID=470096 RepID=A0A6A6VVT8_9PEZI|nr:DUF1295-domain-containing protein [Pseudovirgaria hyperparasitica]KAF2753979.1 DUF1295-domain-containing protein [Pseudovirgaria hyperparasitica]